MPLTRPSPAAEAGDALDISLVPRTRTGLDPVFPMGPEMVGEPALRGAVLAAERLDDDPQRPVKLLVATAPAAEAAERAPRRLAAAQGADVLVGGLGEGKAETLSAVAEELGLPFLDVGSAPVGTCRPGTFSVGADDAMYLAAMARAMAADGVASWYVVHTDTPLGEARHEELATALAREAPPGREVGSLVAPPDQPLYRQAFEAIEKTGAQAAVLLLKARAQLVFLGQYETVDLEAVVYAFSDISQTRQFYAALADDAHDTGSAARRPTRRAVGSVFKGRRRPERALPGPPGLPHGPDGLGGLRRREGSRGRGARGGPQRPRGATAPPLGPGQPVRPPQGGASLVPRGRPPAVATALRRPSRTGCRVVGRVRRGGRGGRGRPGGECLRRLRVSPENGAAEPRFAPILEPAAQ